MRRFLALLVVVGTTGCVDLDLPDFSGRENAFPNAPARPRDPKCEGVALDRSSDVATQGFDEEIQRAVYERTYADCVAWAARGSRTNEP
jgi:hypothetical protein